ncbi:hypothetical protein AAMO2058_001039600 [Amorphochlora amoebiformis]
MALANLALIIPNNSDDSKTAVTNLNERMQQLQKILQFLPADQFSPLQSQRGRFTLRRVSPLQRDSKDPDKTPTDNVTPSPKPSPSPSRTRLNYSPQRSKQGRGGDRKSTPSRSVPPKYKDVDPDFSISNPETATLTMSDIFRFDTEEISKSQHMENEKLSASETMPKSGTGQGEVAVRIRRRFSFDEKKGIEAMKTADRKQKDGDQKKKEAERVQEENSRCDGVMHMQGAHGQWKKRWCRYNKGILEMRYEEKGAIAARMRVGYCMPETQGMKFNESKNDDLYWCYLESQQAYFCFKIFAPDRAHVFRAESGEDCDLFVNTISKDLESRLPADLWQRKLSAAQEMNPLCREQFIIQMTNQQLLINSLSSSGFLQSYLPITSMNKEKSGVLGMETDDGWREYYFVLFEGALYYYQDSKSTTPAGFITLRFASVELDQQRLSQGKFVFHIRTPLRTVSCKARHSVALSEWVASLETSINQEKKSLKEKKRIKQSSMDILSRRSSHDILANINQMLVNINTLEALCKNQTAMETFIKWVEDEKSNVMRHFKFYQENEKLKGMSSTFNDGCSPDSLVSKADRMFHKYFSGDSDSALPGIDKKFIEQIQVELSQPHGKLFKKVEMVIYPVLEQAFKEFKKSPHFAKLTKQLSSKTVMDHRHVSQFPADTHQSFMLKAKGSKRSVEIKLNRRSNMVTIGRDKSNFVVIEDSRVSRSHARVEYTASQCEYIDLGSSCGSKLNGRSVLRAKLKPGDIIEIGMSVLIFCVRKRRKASIFQRLGIKT